MKSILNESEINLVVGLGLCHCFEKGHWNYYASPRLNSDEDCRARCCDCYLATKWEWVEAFDFYGELDVDDELENRPSFGRRSLLVVLSPIAGDCGS